uniref:Uncharacterized protein n=1 Tax=Sphaerodactylus townsendi TaxID=933632 RepID=A0ACB8EDP4_9SAUR
MPREGGLASFLRKATRGGVSHHASGAGVLLLDYVSQCASGKARWRRGGNRTSCSEAAVMAESLESLLRQQRRSLYKGFRAPPWKETYRQRCVERLKNSRARLLDRYRHVGENAAIGGGTWSSLLVQEVMEVEWQALQSVDAQLPSLRKNTTSLHVLEDSDELAVLEEIQKELILQEQLAIEEYEQSLRFDEECLNAMLEGLDAERKVICPVCRRMIQSGSPDS